MKQSLILLVAGTLLLASCSKKGGANSEEAAMQDMPVEVANPVVDSVTLFKTYPGFISSNNMVDVVCQVNGKLLTKNYQSASYVKKGQVLFTVESTVYRDAVQAAQADLATAKSSYDYYSKQYAAMQKALAADAVSQMDVIQAKSNMEKAQAAIRQAEAQLETAKTNLSYCTITAPMSGYITSATHDPGNYLAGGGAPVTLATIYDNSSMMAVFSIEDAQYEKMLTDQTKDKPIDIPLTFSSPLPHDYTAKLSYVDVSVDRSTGTLTIKAKVDNPYDELKNDMYVTASFPYGTNPRAVLVKDASISTDQAGKYLYVVNDSNKVVYTPIEVGDLYRDSLRIVTKGITPQQRYVTQAMMKVRDGMKVKPFMAK